MEFEQFGLEKVIINNIRQCNYTTPTPIQQKIIPHILKKRDIQAIAPTGTGKTAAFALPIINNLLKEKNPTNHIKVLIVAPTKELVVQIDKNIKQYTQSTNINSLAIYGGAKMAPQTKALQGKIDIVVATTGRLVEHIKQKTIDISKLQTLVLDEADTLLDMGFINEINLVFTTIEQKAQVLLFSATLGDSIKKLSDRILVKKVSVNIDKEQKQTHKINQGVYYISKEQKAELLSYIIGQHYKDRFIVFTRTKATAKEISVILEKAGLNIISLHGDMTQSSRLKAISQFKEKKAQVLVATDITARGIDIPNLEYIINYDIPNSVDDYIHRIGRTGRAGATGNAISLVSPSEVYSLKVIERKLQLRLTELFEEGFNDDIKDKIKSPKIVVKKPLKQKTKGAFGKKRSEPKKKKLKGKRSGWNIKDER